MKTVASKVFVSMTCFVIIALIAGCEEENMSASKKERLIAAEKMALQKELHDCNNNVTTLKQEIQKQKDLLVACEQQKQDLEKTSKEKVEASFRLIFETLGKENKELKDENTALKARLEELEKN